MAVLCSRVCTSELNYTAEGKAAFPGPTMSFTRCGLPTVSQESTSYHTASWYPVYEHEVVLEIVIGVRPSHFYGWLEGGCQRDIRTV